MRIRTKKKENLEYSLVNFAVVLRRVSFSIILIVRFRLYAVSMDTDTCQYPSYGVAINQKQPE